MVTQTKNKDSRGMNKTRAYGKMLVVAFGLAVIAVMVVHKVRERRILNLIVEDKDQQLISIHLLLQREMDLNKEMSKKIEDLRPRLHILRSQKMELNGRVTELQSTISSLKDDIKVVESNLHIKNEENKMLRDKITEILKEKVAEIEHLKQINAAQLQVQQHQGVEVQTKEDQFLNSTTATEQKVDVKRVDVFKGLETGSVTRNVDNVDGQGQVGDVTRGGTKLEVPYESKHDAGLRGEGKRSAMSRAKGKKSRSIARNRRLKINALTVRTKETTAFQDGNGNVESSEKMSEKVEFQDVPDELISSLERMTNGTLESKSDELRGVKEDDLQDSGGEESGNGSSEEQDQDDDPHETDADDAHTNDNTEEEEEEEEDMNRSHYSETDSGHNATEEEQK